jgi:hypothetical protein
MNNDLRYQIREYCKKYGWTAKKIADAVKEKYKIELNNGHIQEAFLFKGTPKRRALKEIQEIIDVIGGTLWLTLKDKKPRFEEKNKSLKTSEDWDNTFSELNLSAEEQAKNLIALLKDPEISTAQKVKINELISNLRGTTTKLGVMKPSDGNNTGDNGDSRPIPTDVAKVKGSLFG